MNILFVSQAAWDEKNSVGNTVGNWFGNWEGDTFFHFYTRKQLPNNDIVSEYYNLSAKDILKGFFHGKIEGRRFKKQDIKSLQSKYKAANEQELAMAKKFKESLFREIAFFCSEVLWLSSLWINHPFRSFINTAQPDILFAFATNEYILKPLINYINKEFPNCRTVLYIADDVYQQSFNKSFIRKWCSQANLRFCLNNADKVYGASTDLCKKYNNLYDINASPLYKGCIFEQNVKKTTNDPIRLVYAGNLLYGRDSVLAELASIINECNLSGYNLTLEIYTGTPVDDELKRKLNIGSSSILNSAKPYPEIKEILANADIVLEIESFDEKIMDSVRYSFSTKVIDCLQSGSTILAIGPKGQSAIEYIRTIKGAYVVDKLDLLENTIVSIAKNPELLPERAASIREYAIINHDINHLRNELRTDLLRVRQLH